MVTSKPPVIKWVLTIPWRIASQKTFRDPQIVKKKKDAPAKEHHYEDRYFAANNWTHLEAQSFVILDREIKDASAQGITGPQLENARRLLETLPARVREAGGHGDDIDIDDFHWLNENVDRTQADVARIQVLAALTELDGR